ncbi:MAG: hypothetical protein H8E44_06450 [Planctomycetes bacterium]|nr:hypothetical protein [Planctomycetota bacterium]
MAEGLILRAFLNWLGLMIAGTVALPILPFLLLFGVAPRIVQAVYSAFVIIPVLLLLQLNALLYLILAVCDVSLNYDRAFYGAVKWIEEKKLYDAIDSGTKMETPLHPYSGEKECPRDHGPLKEWSGEMRCWSCGWPYK